SGNVLETGGGNQRQTDQPPDARKRGISRESATNGNHPQTPNPPYKQEVAGSSPAPPIVTRSLAVCRQRSCRLGSSPGRSLLLFAAILMSRRARLGCALGATCSALGAATVSSTGLAAAPGN